MFLYYIISAFAGGFFYWIHYVTWFYKVVSKLKYFKTLKKYDKGSFANYVTPKMGFFTAPSRNCHKFFKETKFLGLDCNKFLDSFSLTQV
jgi:hypothetical protein